MSSAPLPALPPPPPRDMWPDHPIKLHYSEYTAGLPVSVLWDRAKEARDPHFHDFQEIAIITHGVGCHVSQYASWPVQVGDVLVIGGKQVHCYDRVHDLEMVNILFRRDFLTLNADDIAALDGFQALFGIANLRAHKEFRSRFRLDPRDLSMVLCYVAALEQELASNHPGRAYFVRIYFMLIVGMLSRLHSAQRDLDSNAVLRLAKVINHLEAHFTEEHSISDLARLAGLSERGLQRLFQKATGHSPHAHLLQLRLNRAAADLRDPKLQITEIAFSVGFNDSNYFTRQFKKRMGASPVQYRQKILRTG